MNERKAEILQYIEEGTAVQKRITEDYRREYPYDTDGSVLQGYVSLCRGDYAEAKLQLEGALRYCPYDVDAYYLLGTWYARQGHAVKAIRYLAKSALLQDYYRQEYLFFHTESCERQLGEMYTLLDRQRRTAEGEEARGLEREYEQLCFENGNSFYLFASIIHQEENMAGRTLYFGNGRVYYSGLLNPMCDFLMEDREQWNFIETKGEILPKVFEGQITGFGTNQSVLLPILSKSNNNGLTFIDSEGKRVQCLQFFRNHFNYYRIDKPVNIFGEEEFVMGSPVPLGHSPERKKLVISLFVDGLSQKLLQEEGLWKLMPYTYVFFKRGLLCENVFTTSDWTYPSLASFVSGMEVPEHMMIHPDINVSLPEDTRLLFEYMKEAGYYTGMINGDWRSCEPYGYLRGIDRCVIQSAYVGMSTAEVVHDAISHMEAFRETDQYLWIGTSDLHMVADGFDLPLAVQTHTSLEERAAEKKSLTSVKQEYSSRKRQQYIKLMGQVDLQLRSLYEYIENNFREEEFSFTLFGDHGQTYLNKPGEFHLSRNHSNVAFMCRGGGVSGRSREYISAVSYPAIACSLAGIALTGTPLKKKLPAVFGGEEEREYVITETIHPGDPYMAAIHGKWGAFYYRTGDVLSEYGKLPRGEAEYTFYNSAGKRIVDDGRCQRYVEMLQERLNYLYEY